MDLRNRGETCVMEALEAREPVVQAGDVQVGRVQGRRGPLSQGEECRFGSNCNRKSWDLLLGKEL